MSINTPLDQLYALQERIGRGSFGQVYKGINKQTGQTVAIKVLNLDSKEEDIEVIQREIFLLQRCDSEYITRYHASYLQGTKLCVVMDYAKGGSLRDILRSGPVEEIYINVIIRDVLLALCYLHKSGIIHRDIKAANILLTEEGYVKLCDFGVAGQFSVHSLKRHSFVGTPFWMAPEVMKRTAYDFRADIWSLGITTFEIATGGPPHASKDPMKALFISEFKDIQLPESFSPLMKEFMTLCLHEDPKFRPAADELLKFKWIKNAPKGTEILLDLVIRHTEWQLSQAESSSCKTALSDDDLMLERHADDWNFDTVQSIQIQNQTSPTNYTNVKHEKFSEESSTSMIAPLPSTLPSRKGHRRNKTSIIKTLEASPTKTDAPQIPVLSISPEDTKAPILTDHIPRKNSEFSFLYDTALNQVFSTVPRQSKMESHFSQGSKILKELKTSPSLPFIIDTSILTKKSDKSLNRKSSLREENPTPLKPTFFSKSRAMDSRIYKPIKLINSALKKEQLTPSRPRASTAPEMYRQGDSRNTVSRISYLLNFHSRRKSSLLSTSNDPGPSLSDDTTSHLSAETSTSLTNSRRSNSVLSFFHKSKSEASDSLDRQPAHSLDRLSTSFMFSTEGTHSLKEPPKKKEWCSSVFYNEVVNQTSSTSAFIPTEPMPITSIQVQSLGQLNCPAMVERPDMFLESEATSDLQTHQMESQFNELCEACWYWLDLSEQHMQRISTLERKA